jgi:hypothetical protein
MVDRGVMASIPAVKDGGSWFSGKAGSNIRTERSRTWAAANNFHEYLSSGGRAKQCTEEDLAIGDVVQLRDYGIIYHTMMVTGVLPTTIRNKYVALLTYHTTDTLHKPITAIGKEKICWKIADTFEEKVRRVMLRAG